MGETVDDIRRRKIAEARRHKITAGVPVRDKQGNLYYKDSAGNIYDSQGNLIKRAVMKSEQVPVTPTLTPPKRITSETSVKPEQITSETRVKPERKRSKKEGYTGFLINEFLEECRFLQVKPRDLQSWTVVELRNRRMR
jgi:hypothetical protein